MRLLIADKLDLEPLAGLELLGVRVDYQPELSADQLAATVDDCAILVVRSTQVSAAAIANAPALSLIVRAGVGVSNIDVAAASRHGIYVANCPGRNAAAVAELTMALILALDRRLVDATQSLREGRWEKTSFQRARGIYGQRLGVAGVGAIGHLVIERARAFGMQVYAWSRSLTPTKARRLGVRHCLSLETLAANSDVITFHMPASAQTRKMVSRQVLEALPDGATLINTARAAIIDDEALRELIVKKGLRVGLDVFAQEPSSAGEPFDNSLLHSGLVYGTPHIAASTRQAQHAIASEVSEIVRAFLTEEEVPNVVNVCRNTPARYALVLRARDEVGVLANVLNVVKRHGLNIEEISNDVFNGAAAACTKLRVSGRPGEECLREIRAFVEVLHVDVVSLPSLA